jgi:Ca2+-binding RTX toxin-like protein
MALIKSGTEEVLTTGVGTSVFPKILALANSLVLHWTDPIIGGADGDGSSIQMLRVDTEGNALGSQTIVNTVTDGNQGNSVAALLPNGNFLIGWNTPDGIVDIELAYRRFTSDGTAVDTNEQRATTDSTNQFMAGVAPRDDGGFIFAYSITNTDISVRVHGSDGNLIGSPVAIASTENRETGGTITKLSNGAFVVSWIGAEEPNPVADDPQTARFQRIDANGNKLGGIVDITSTSPDVGAPTIAALSGGRFVAAWDEDGQDGSGSAIRAQIFNADGTKSGATFTVNTTTAGNQTSSALVGLPDGGFVAVWLSNEGSSQDNIRAQAFDAAGAKVGEELLVNLPDNGTEYRVTPRAPDIELLPDGRIAVIWETSTNRSFVSDTEIHMQILGIGVAPPSGPTGGDDTLNGEPGVDVIDGLGGNDTIHGNGGSDHLIGGAGNDRLYGGADDDLLDGSTGADTADGGAGNDTHIVDNAGDDAIEAAGQGTDLVKASVSFTLGANVENLTLAGGGAIDGTGNTLSNIITGNDAANRLNGGAGIDTLTGAAGKDTFVFDAALGKTNPNADVITDFNPADDTIELAVSVFPKLKAGVLKNKAFDSGKKKPSKDKHLVYYDEKNGDLWYDLNGRKQKGKGDVLIATLDKGLDLTAADIIVS